MFARLRCRSLQRGGAERDDDAIDLLPERHPPLAQDAVPLGNLFGVVAQHGLTR
jgi:hypothetical protein